MPAKALSRDRGAAKAAEKRMRNWELARAQRIETSRPVCPDVHDFVSMSHVVGAGGAEIANLLGQRLGWPTFDKQILQAMAGDDELRARLYSSMDERDLGWFEETIRTWTDADFRKNDYFHRLTEVVFHITSRGPAVFLGRATDLILPTSKGLRVRVVAPRERCVAEFARQHQLSIEQARVDVARIEHERALFIRNHFRVDPADQGRFDMIINVERFSHGEAVELIMSALRMRGIVRRG